MLFVYLPTMKKDQMQAVPEVDWNNQIGTILDNFEKSILEGEDAKKSLGADSLLSVSEAELIDSNPLYEDYLGSVGNKIDREEGQQLVYTENLGFKIVNIPHSLALWAKRKQEKSVCLIKPNIMIVLQKAIESLPEQQVEDLYRMAILNLLMDTIVWELKHAKGGCRYCNRSAELQVMPALYQSLKTSRIGSKSLIGEEEYMAKRISDVVRLPGNIGQTHDIVVPKKLVRGLIQQIYKAKDTFVNQEINANEYIKRFSKDVAFNSAHDRVELKTAIMLTTIVTKNNPGAKE